MLVDSVCIRKPTRHPSLFASLMEPRMTRLGLKLCAYMVVRSKCQCTVQLTVFADGQARVKPWIIFWRKREKDNILEKVVAIY